MKKIVAILLVLSAIVAAGAFAQEGETSTMTFAFMGQGTFLPFQIVNYGENRTVYGEKGGTRIQSGVGSYFSRTPLMWFTARASTSRLAMQAEMYLLETSELDVGPMDSFPGTNVKGGYNWVQLGNNAWVEVKPIDWLRFRAGKFYFGDLSGKNGGTNGFWSYYSVVGVSNDRVFQQFKSHGIHDWNIATPNGFLITAAPIEGLLVAASVSSAITTGNTRNPLVNPTAWYEESKWVFQRAQVAVGYTIDGIGLARLQYIGDYDHIEHARDCDVVYGDTFGRLSAPMAPALTPAGILGYTFHQRRIEGAFNLTMLDMVKVDIGAKFYLPVSGTYKIGGVKAFDYSFMQPVNVAIQATANMDAFRLIAALEGRFMGQNTYKANGSNTLVVNRPFYLNAHLTPSYNLGFGTVGGDIGYVFNNATEYNNHAKAAGFANVDGYSDFGISAWFQMPIGTGLVGAGLGFAMFNLYADSDVTKANQVIVVSLPISIQYTF